MSEQQPRGVITRRHPFADLDFLKRWEPLRGVMSDFFVDWPAETQKEGAIAPPVDITESDDAYLLRAELPGVAKDDITVEVEDHTLCIRGEKRTQRDERSERGRRLECSFGAFSRSFGLPNDANAEQISAEFRDGVLEVSVAKCPESKPKQIAVRSDKG